MKAIFYFVLVMVLTSTSFAQLDNASEAAVEYATKGYNAINNGEYGKAIELFTKARDLDPVPIEYPYEIALAYYQKKDYEEAAKLLDSLRSHPQVNDHVYQLLGNCYDNVKDKTTAIKTYQEGLVKYPNSGRLYMELGLAELDMKRPRDVMVHWENGVRFDPQYPNNYFYLAKYFSNAGEKLWAVFYGEMFANLSDNAKRLEDNSSVLFNTYLNGLFSQKDSSVDIAFTRVKILRPEGSKVDTAKESFEMAFQRIMSESAKGLKRMSQNGFSIKELNDIRVKFLNLWYKEKLDRKFPNIVISRHKELLDKKMFEAYNYWLFQKGSMDEFWAWKQKYKKKFEDFLDYSVKNPMKVDSEHNFQRYKYQ